MAKINVLCFSLQVKPNQNIASSGSLDFIIRLFSIIPVCNSSQILLRLLISFNKMVMFLKLLVHLSGYNYSRGITLNTLKSLHVILYIRFTWIFGFQPLPVSQPTAIYSDCLPLSKRWLSFSSWCPASLGFLPHIYCSADLVNYFNTLIQRPSWSKSVSSFSYISVLSSLASALTTLMSQLLSTENIWGPIGSSCTITCRSWLSSIVFPWLGKIATHTEVGAWMHSRLCSQWEQTSQECGLDLLHMWSTFKTARWNHLQWICEGCVQYWVTLLRSVIEMRNN